MKVTDNGKIIFDESVGANTSEQFSKEELVEIFNHTKLKVDKILKSGIGYMCLLSKFKDN